MVTGPRPPYGYKVKSEAHKAWLEIDESEAPIVKLIYDWYLYGDDSGTPLSSNAIAIRLTKLGIPTRGDKQIHYAKKFGYGVWQRAMIIHILTNKTYTGVWYFGKTKMVEDGFQRAPKSKRGMGKQVPSAREEWIPVSVPVIIDSKVFEEVQKRKEYIKQMLSERTEHEYLMKGRLTCAKCGYSVRGHTIRHKHYYYYCSGKATIVKLCDIPNVRGDLVDAIVWQWAKSIVENPENMRVGLDNVQNEFEQANQSLYTRMEIIDEQVQEHQKQLDRLLDLYLAGNFPKDALNDRKYRLEQMLTDLQKEKNELLGHIRKVSITDDQLAYIESFCDKIRKGLDQADFKTRRKILELLDIRGKIAVENDERVIYLKCLIGPEQGSHVLISRS